MGRDYAIRVMMGSRISLLVGLIATAIIFVIGSLIGSISAFFGGWVDLIIMRIVDIIYTIPDFLLIVLLSFALKDPLANLAQLPGFGWMQIVGSNLISIFIVFALLYWVGMARMVRSQILTLKENDYVMAAKALGAKDGRIIKKHLLTNCIGTLIVTTTLQIPSATLPRAFFRSWASAFPRPCHRWAAWPARPSTVCRAIRTACSRRPSPSPSSSSASTCSATACAMHSTRS